eukprot:3715292-Pleurochrysis_carterae.AAC.4
MLASSSSGSSSSSTARLATKSVASPRFHTRGVSICFGVLHEGSIVRSTYSIPESSGIEAEMSTATIVFITSDKSDDEGAGVEAGGESTSEGEGVAAGACSFGALSGAAVGAGGTGAGAEESLGSAIVTWLQVQHPLARLEHVQNATHTERLQFARTHAAQLHARRIHEPQRKLVRLGPRSLREHVRVVSPLVQHKREAVAHHDARSLVDAVRRRGLVPERYAQVCVHRHVQRRVAEAKQRPRDRRARKE